MGVEVIMVPTVSSTLPLCSTPKVTWWLITTSRHNPLIVMTQLGPGTTFGRPSCRSMTSTRHRRWSILLGDCRWFCWKHISVDSESPSVRICSGEARLWKQQKMQVGRKGFPTRTWTGIGILLMLILNRDGHLADAVVLVGHVPTPARPQQ